ncbi:MAG: hypothetical protein ACO2OS_02275 [Thermosphaera aggregans]|uniref:hypothetical protein n=1 Tax=Thermosphaera aggregans TaxID=54254 RepID=UPI003C021CA3
MKVSPGDRAQHLFTTVSGSLPCLMNLATDSATNLAVSDRASQEKPLGAGIG